MVEEPLAKILCDAGHAIERQVSCVGGRVDILDFTTGEIIECKAWGSASDIAAAVTQLYRYRPGAGVGSPFFRHSTGRLPFRGRRLVVAVPSVEHDALWLADIVRRKGIRIIEVRLETEAIVETIDAAQSLTEPAS